MSGIVVSIAKRGETNVFIQVKGLREELNLSVFLSGDLDSDIVDGSQVTVIGILASSGKKGLVIRDAELKR